MLYSIFSMIEIFSIADNGEGNIALQRQAYTVKPVYNDHLMEYFSAFRSSSGWPMAT